jgi:hypothetical protein
MSVSQLLKRRKEKERERERETKQGLSNRTASNEVNKAGKHFLIDLNPVRALLGLSVDSRARRIVSGITL